MPPGRDPGDVAGYDPARVKPHRGIHILRSRKRSTTRLGGSVRSMAAAWPGSATSSTLRVLDDRWFRSNGQAGLGAFASRVEEPAPDGIRYRIELGPIEDWVEALAANHHVGDLVRGEVGCQVVRGQARAAVPGRHTEFVEQGVPS
jgi:hypothetical protein